MPKSLLSVVAGNTPDVRGKAVDHLLRRSPHAVVLAVSIQGRDGGYPFVQRFVSGVDAGPRGSVVRGTTGDPVVVLRQDLLTLRRGARPPHVVLTLPEELDVLPFLVELWRPRIGASALGDHYDPAPLMVALDPASFLADIGCVHRAVALWNGIDRTAPLTPAEVAARQVEAADVLIVPGAGPSDERWDPSDERRAGGVAALAGHLNPSATLLPHAAHESGTGATGPAALTRPAPRGTIEEWRARLEPVTVRRPRRGIERSVESVLWRARRPLHPARLADALADVMSGVVRSRGHLWLSSRPGSVVTWRSAGPHLELRETDRWLELGDEHAWRSASPQRRTMASWFWHDYYGERRNEIVFTGIDLDRDRLRSALDAALLNDAELSLGPDGWAGIPDPLLADPS
ncbi:GTP-binding protein [Streptomyces halobius]|uniref:GTP-binding protein n=1 Tax=Streptomyces halobius TaxID=2879846 RepID=A0ABY4LZD4_9ACTN|nr:GTP-binding protein [Streptomyces halobius]UQA90818.1 GTP-binding protein [Streptomyces halobius]